MSIRQHGASKIVFCSKITPSREQTIQFASRKTVLQIAVDNDLKLDHSCGGMGTCGTCRVIVRSSSEALPKRNELEEEMANERKFNQNERLACQLAATSGMIIELP